MGDDRASEQIKIDDAKAHLEATHDVKIQMFVDGRFNWEYENDPQDVPKHETERDAIVSALQYSEFHGGDQHAPCGVCEATLRRLGVVARERE